MACIAVTNDTVDIKGIRFEEVGDVDFNLALLRILRKHPRSQVLKEETEEMEWFLVHKLTNYHNLFC